MALTRDKSTTFASTRSWKGSKQNYTASFEIDFSATDMSLAQNEIMRVCVIPAGTAITSFAVKVLTAETEITDVDFGVTTGTTTSATLADGLTFASTGWLAGNVDLSATGGGVIQTADSNLLITNKDANTLDSAKIQVVLNIVDFAQAIV